MGGVFEDFFDGEAGLDDVLAEDIVQGQGMGHGLDAGHVDFADLIDVLEDGGELGGELGQLIFGEGEAGEFGDVADLI